METSRLDRRFEEKYGACVKVFFEGLKKLGLTKDELNAVPSLFLPGWGDAYESSLLKIAIAGKETAYWSNEYGDSLLCDLDVYSSGSYDVFSSCEVFRRDGPAKWRNPFWWYSATVLGKLFSVDRDLVLSKENITLRSIAWFNGHAVETMQSQGVDRGGISWETMAKIQDLADKSGVSDFSQFIRVFKPDVILYFYRNGSADPLRNFPDCELCKKWGENEDVHEYDIDETIVLQMRHTTWMTHGNMAQDACADLVYEILKQRGFLTFLQEKANTTFDMYNMDVATWRRLVRFVRDEALAHADMDNTTLSRHLMVVLARELRKVTAKMTARTLVAILNEVDRFRADNWQYSEERRGPCRSVRGAYNAYEGTADADLIAEAFTKMDGSYAYE